MKTTTDTGFLTDASSGSELLLLTILDFAVPLRIQQKAHWGMDRILERVECARLADEIAAHGDAMMYRRKGQTTMAFVELVNALARLAYMPGGIRFAGRVFCADERPLPRPLAKVWPGSLSAAESREASKIRRKDR